MEHHESCDLVRVYIDGSIEIECHPECDYAAKDGFWYDEFYHEWVKKADA